MLTGSLPATTALTSLSATGAVRARLYPQALAISLCASSIYWLGHGELVPAPLQYTLQELVHKHLGSLTLSCCHSGVFLTVPSCPLWDWVPALSLLRAQRSLPSLPLSLLLGPPGIISQINDLYPNLCLWACF